MKFRFFSFLIAALALGAAVSCQDQVSEIGTSLTGDAVEILIDSSFTVSGRTVTVDVIKPKSIEQLIGEISIPAYGTLHSDVVTQFLPTTELDTADFTYENVDSIFLNLRYANSSFIGDSVAPMRLSVYPLKKGYLYSGMPSNFDPDGKYETTALGSQIYNASTRDSAGVTGASSKAVNVKLPLELGRRLFKAFEDNPADYANGQTFAENVFPGIYMTSTFGSGRLTVFSTCAMTMYLRKIYVPEGKTEKDTIDAVHLYYLTSPEVISNNNLRYEMSDNLKQLIAQGHTLMVAPCGTEIELTFPIEQIMAKYHNYSDRLAVVNTLSMSIPVDTIKNGVGITPPPYALLVLKKDRDKFFADNKLPDNITSFYTTYNSSNQTYNFNGLSSYVNEMLKRDEVTADDYTFSLIPVQVNFEELANSGYYYGSATTESDIQPYLVSPVMADLRLDKAKIKFTFSLKKN